MYIIIIIVIIIIFIIIIITILIIILIIIIIILLFYIEKDHIDISSSLYLNNTDGMWCLWTAAISFLSASDTRRLIAKFISLSVPSWQSLQLLT